MGFKVIRYCKLCKVKFFVPGTSSRKYYCDTCQEKVEKQRDEEEARAAKEGKDL